MTVSSTTRAVSFIGNGGAAVFAFAFKVFAASDLLAAVTTISTGAVVLLDLTTDYSAALNSDQNTSPGGSITLLAGPLATGLSLTITSAMTFTQLTSLANAGGFYPSVINDVHDRLTILAQQLQETLSRALTLPLSDSSTAALPPAPARAGKILGFDVAGNPSMITVAFGGTVPSAQMSPGAVDGMNQDFIFTASSTLAPAPIVFAGGVFQSPIADYAAPVFVSGNSWKITFTAAPVNGPVTVLLLA